MEYLGGRIRYRYEKEGNTLVRILWYGIELLLWIGLFWMVTDCLDTYLVASFAVVLCLEGLILWVEERDGWDRSQVFVMLLYAMRRSIDFNQLQSV